MRVELRPATLDDADSVATVFLRSRKELVAFAPLAHVDDDVRGWIARRLIPAGRTTVAVVDGAIVGFVSVSPARECSWITQLYLHPGWIGRGIGTRLLELVLKELPWPIRLYTFQANQRARTFYERRGFEAIAFTDGANNEEKCPDVLYEWRPADGRPAVEAASPSASPRRPA
jgi:GNAT superfamily N-acetyltransferase